jgi:hypothetical protein
MVWEEVPRIEEQGAILRKPGQSSDEIVPVKAVENGHIPLNTPTDNMVQETGGIQPC